MKIEPFELERYFAQHEFTARYMLSPSDCESMPMSELLALADDQTRALWGELRLGYTESSGHLLLLEEIARLYPGLSAGDVLTAAPEEAIFIVMNVLLSPGDRVVTLTPSYQSLHSVARAIGCEVIEWPLRVSERKWALDLDALPGLLSQPTRLLVVNFPNNPTGYLPTREEWREVIRLAEASGAYLFSDEMYRLLEYDPAARLSPACVESARAITLSGLSKSFGLPGLRTGWLATRDEALMAQFKGYKDYTTICASAPGEVLSIIALRSREVIVGSSLELVRRNLELARAFFSGQPERYQWLEPSAGSVAFPRWLGEGTAERFTEQMLSGKGIMVVPGSMFAFPGEHFRVGLGRKNLPEVLKVLEIAS